MPYYVSLVDRRVASTKGPCFTFKAMEPLLINENDATIPDVEAAGVLTVAQMKAALAVSPDWSEFQETAPVAVSVPDDTSLDVGEEDGDIEGEMRELRYADRLKKEAWEAARAKEDQAALEKALEAEEKLDNQLEVWKTPEEAPELAEKSPAFDQVVFEAAVREVLEAGDKQNLTPKGMPKAVVVSKLCGFDVKAIKIVQYCKAKEK